jgi:hypothetical protein
MVNVGLPDYEDPVAGGLRLIKALVSCLTEDMG